MKYVLFLILFWGMSCVSSHKVQNRPTFAKPNAALKALDKNQYQIDSIESENTLIHLYLKKDSALDSDKIKKSVKKVWPIFNKVLSIKPTEIALLDSEGPIGGGPVESFIATLYSTKKMNPLFKKLVTQATGWSAQDSTQEYIKKHYSEFSDPEQAYIDDIVIHELAHTIFGFGLTTASKDQDGWWFTFGLGLLYDRLVWDKLYDKESPLFKAAVLQWKNHFSKIQKLDQRLVKPSLAQDEKYNLSRLQVYGHGKALIYLGELRQFIGAERFDKAVFSTIQNRATLEYDQFIDQFFHNEKAAIISFEKRFNVR